MRQKTVKTFSLGRDLGRCLGITDQTRREELYTMKTLLIATLPKVASLSQPQLKILDRNGIFSSTIFLLKYEEYVVEWRGD